MRKFSYILFVVIIALVSCSKEQPLQPINASESFGPQMIKVDQEQKEKDILQDSDDDDDKITDPEKEEKEKTNKKAKN